MALELETNCGFVTEAPTADPDDTAAGADDRSNAVAQTAPEGAIKIIEVGWYCTGATEAANFEVGVYTDDGSDDPDSLIFSNTTNAKGTTAGWKKVTGLNWDVTGGVKYWIAVQLDNTATNSFLDSVNSGGEGWATKTTQTSLPASWSGSDLKDINGMYSIYALYEINISINIADAWKDVKAIKINIGDTWKTIKHMKINSNGSEWAGIF